MIRFPCFSCLKTLQVGDEYAGRSARCPHCQNPVTVPDAPLPAMLGPALTPPAPSLPAIRSPQPVEEARPPSFIPQTAGGVVRDASHKPDWSQVRLSARVIHWPNQCACCNGPAGDVLEIEHVRTEGRNYGETRKWAAPYCASCLGHIQAWRDSERLADSLGPLLDQQRAFEQQVASGQPFQRVVIGGPPQSFPYADVLLVLTIVFGITTTGCVLFGILAGAAAMGRPRGEPSAVPGMVCLGTFSAMLLGASALGWHVARHEGARWTREARARWDRQQHAAKSRWERQQQAANARIEQERQQYIQALAAGQHSVAQAIARIERFKSPRCCMIRPAIVYEGWHGTVHTFSFANEEYARLFTRGNSEKLV